MVTKSFSNTLASIIRMAVQILTIPILIKNIGIEEYGLWSLISAILAFGMLAEFGLSVTATTFIASSLAVKDNQKTSENIFFICMFALFTSTISAFTIFVFSGHILSLSKFLSQDSTYMLNATKVLQVGVVLLVSRIFQQVITGIAYGYGEYVLINILSTLYVVISNIGIIIITSYGGKSLELMYFLASISTIATIVYAITIAKKVELFFCKISWDEFNISNLIHYSFYAWISTVGNTLFAQGDRLVIATSLTSVEVGIYSTIINVASQINGLTTAVMHPVIPKISTLWTLYKTGSSNSSYSTLKTETRKLLSLNFFVSLLTGIVLSVFASEIINILMSEQADKIAATKQLQIALFVYTVLSVNAFGYYILFSVNAVKESAIIQNISGAASLLCIALLSQNYGLNGAVIGNVVSFLSCLLTIIGISKLSIYPNEWLYWILPNLFLLIIFFIANYTIFNSANIFLEVFIAIFEVLSLSLLFSKQMRSTET
jgi:O-antigen/teichoic acid export membrane protein